MAKLYPPLIEGTLPAFTNIVLNLNNQWAGWKDWSSKKILLTVPYVMNRSVAFEQVTGVSLILKEIATNNIILTTSTSNYKSNYEAIFDLSEIENINTKIKLGQKYKAQIAYIDSNDEIGYYSTVGIIKYTAPPFLSLDYKNGQMIANNSQSGIYVNPQDETENIKHNADSSEKIYSYRFEVRDGSENILETSGWQIHNYEKDINNNINIDEYTIKGKYNWKHFLAYEATTTNGLKVLGTYNFDYLAYPADSIFKQLKIKGESDEEKGVIKLSFSNLSNITGTFCIYRSSSKNNFNLWEKVHEAYLYGDIDMGSFFEDSTVESGCRYKYGLELYNENSIVSSMYITDEIEVSFDHMFLTDGTRTLKLKYNPKVSSFKETLLESKVNTLGSKYPFFFRNSQVGYKEFPIAGLLTRLSDEDEAFAAGASLGDRTQTSRDKTASSRTEEPPIGTDLTGHNFGVEKNFKMAVLDFMNDPKPKLFRSPAEGNYLVRLMNTSLTPMDQLGRMLHTVQTTASECGSADFSNLLSLGIITLPEQPIRGKKRTKTIVLNKDNQKISLIDYINLEKIECFSIAPSVEVRYSDTGSFETETRTQWQPDEKPINMIEIQGDNARLVVQLTYTDIDNIFNHCISIERNTKTPDLVFEKGAFVHPKLMEKTGEKQIAFVEFYSTLEVKNDTASNEEYVLINDEKISIPPSSTKTIDDLYDYGNIPNITISPNLSGKLSYVTIVATYDREIREDELV